jgi:hypothetical protein
VSGNFCSDNGEKQQACDGRENTFDPYTKIWLHMLHVRVSFGYKLGLAVAGRYKRDICRREDLPLPSPLTSFKNWMSIRIFCDSNLDATSKTKIPTINWFICNGNFERKIILSVIASFAMEV